MHFEVKEKHIKYIAESGFLFGWKAESILKDSLIEVERKSSIAPVEVVNADLQEKYIILVPKI